MPANPSVTSTLICSVDYLPPSPNTLHGHFTKYLRAKKEAKAAWAKAMSQGGRDLWQEFACLRSAMGN